MRISNLKKGVVGVCAATMLAGMCAVPAFAAVTPTEPGTWDSVDASNTGKTIVNAEVDAQVQVTVPTSFTAAVDADGAFQLPNNVALKNTSTLAKAHVTAVAVTEGDGKLIASDATATDPNSVKMTVNALDLSKASAFATGSSWEIEKASSSSAPSTLPLTFSGSIVNPSSTGAIHLFDITWTVAFGPAPTV